MTVKKLRWTDVGGCGGSIFRSNRQADVPIAVRFTIHPPRTWSGVSDSKGRLNIELLKVGTVSVYETIEFVEISGDVDDIKSYADKLNAKFQDINMSDEEQKLHDEYMAMKKAKTQEAISNTLKKLPFTPKLLMPLYVDPV